MNSPCLLKVWSDGYDLVDQVLHTDDAKFAQLLLDNLVIGQGDTLLVDLAAAVMSQKVGLRIARPEV